MKCLTLKAAAQHTGVSKSKIWRSVNDGTLLASKGRTSGGQEAWVVEIGELERWAETALKDSETVIEDLVQDSKRLEEVEAPQAAQSDSESFEVVQMGDSESFRPIQGPPVELYMALVDRVTRSERRSVELEMELRKHRLLLTENAESLIEREATLTELEARRQEAETLLRLREEERLKALAETTKAFEEAARARQEAERATLELTSLKTEIATKEAQWSERRRPWYRKMFGKSS